MGFGLMGAGAAVSGLMGGYQQGRKFAQDEERFGMEKERFGLEKEEAGQRKRLREEQIKGAGLTNKRAEMEMDDAEYNRRVDEQGNAITQRFLREAYGSPDGSASPAPAQAAGAAAAPAGAIANPAAEMAQTPSAAPAQASGISLPGGAAPAGSSEPAKAPQRSRFEILGEMNSALLNNELKKRGVNRGAILKQAVESARFFSKAETNFTLDVMRRFEAGVPQEKLFDDMKANGVQVLPGTNFSLVEKKDDRTGMVTKDVVINLPDGRRLSKGDIEESAMDRKDLFDIKTKLGTLNATVSHHAAMQSLAEEANRDKRLNYAETIKRLDAQIAQQNRAFGLREEEFKENQWERIKASAEKSFARTFNYTPLDDVKLNTLRRDDEDRPINLGADGKPDPNKKTRVEQYQERIVAADGDLTMAMLTFARNRDPRTGRPNATEAEVVQALRRAQEDRAKPADKRTAVQYDDLGHAFVNVNNSKVLLPFSKPQAAAGEPKTRSEQSRDAGGPVSRAPGIDYERMPLAQLASSAAYSAEARRVYERRVAEQRALPGTPGFWKGVTPPPPAAVSGGLDAGR